MHNTTIRKLFNELNLEPPAAYLLIEEVDSAITATAASNPVGEMEAELRARKFTSGKQAHTRLTAVARELTEKDRMYQVANQLAGAIDDLYKDSLAEAGDDLIAELQPQFTAAIDTIVRTTGLLGTNPTDQLVGGLGTDAAVAWQERKNAARTLAAVHRFRIALAQAGYGTRDVNVAWYTTDPDPLALEQAARTFNRGGEGLVNLATFDVVVHLNTADEANTVNAKSAEAQAKAMQRAAEAKAAARRPGEWGKYAEQLRQDAQRKAS